MKELVATIQKWDELRKQETEEIVEKVLQEANRVLKEWIAEGKHEGELCISYWNKKFKVGMEYQNEATTKKAKVPFAEIEKVSVILKRIMATFKEFPQLEVTTRPFGHQNPQYDINYSIIVRLKE